MKKLTNRLRRVGDAGLFHDSRADARLIAKFCNEIADKVNELIEENAKLKTRIEELEKDKPCQ